MGFLTEWLAAWIRAVFFPLVRLTECPAEEYIPEGGGEAVRNGEAITTLLPPCSCHGHGSIIFDDGTVWVFCLTCYRDVEWRRS